MSVQKIIANTTSEGLKRIREEIGNDALILKTVKRNGKVEFFVEAEDSVEEIENVALFASQAADPGEHSTGLITEYRDAKLKMLSSIAAKADAPDDMSVLDDDGREPVRQKRQSMRSELTVKNLIEALELTPAIGARLRGFKRIDEVVDNLALMIQPGPNVTEGIHAFVGPAGSGKTTSLVKLITRHIMQHGEDSCAIINCDRFRMGAREQPTR
ncbi:MAG: flagellar biosynthesis GTPase FlhF [Candidatus Azotimanducaceae bacterium]|jgi:flagellar biosynthesis GTPase FlhF